MSLDLVEFRVDFGPFIESMTLILAPLRAFFQQLDALQAMLPPPRRAEPRFRTRRARKVWRARWRS